MCPGEVIQLVERKRPLGDDCDAKVTEKEERHHQKM